MQKIKKKKITMMVHNVVLMLHVQKLAASHPAVVNWVEYMRVKTPTHATKVLCVLRRVMFAELLQTRWDYKLTKLNWLWIGGIYEKGESSSKSSRFKIDPFIWSQSHPFIVDLAARSLLKFKKEKKKENDSSTP